METVPVLQQGMMHLQTLATMTTDVQALIEIQTEILEPERRIDHGPDRPPRLWPPAGARSFMTADG